jgi:hypothetical protein
MKILIRGPLLSMSGYGNHARQIFELVKSAKPKAELYCDVLTWGNTSWILSQEYCSDNNFNEIIQKTMLSYKVNETQFDEVYHIGLPNEWKPFKNTRNIGVTAGIESDVCKEEWIDDLNRMDLVIVPSEFSKETFTQTSSFSKDRLETDVCVIPEWFYVEFEDQHDDKHNLLKSVKTDENVLIIGQITSTNPENDRKNMSRTLRETAQYLETIDKDIGIVLKILTSGSNEKAKDLARDIVQKEVKSSNTPVYLLFGNMTPYELQSLYTDPKITCLLSGTRGECFGLTMLEAAVSKLLTVTTGWSAHKEHVNYSFSLDYDLKLVPPNNTGFFSTSSRWAEYKKTSLEKQLYNVFVKKDVDCDALEKQAEFLINNYSKNAIISKYSSFLNG